MRICGAVLICIVPALLSLWLLHLGDLDHRQCLNFAGNASARPEVLFETWDAALSGFGASLRRDLAHPLMWALLFGPFFGFALVDFLTKTSALRRTNLIFFLIFCGFVLYSLSNPESHHDCDRKGTDQFFLFFLYAPLGLVIAALPPVFYLFKKAARNRGTQ